MLAPDATARPRDITQGKLDAPGATAAPLPPGATKTPRTGRLLRLLLCFTDP